MNLSWLLLAGALACSERESVHAEAWVDPGGRSIDEMGALLTGLPLSVDGPGRDGRLRVIAGEEGLAAMRRLGLGVEVARPDHRRPPGSLEGYHDEQAMAEALAALAEAWPDAELVDLGRTVEDRPILGLRIGSGPWGVRILGAHHGDELSSSELALAVAERLLEDPVQAEVWVVPQVNPDGVADGSRYNARWVDLNRNYGYEWSEREYFGGDGPFSEPESRAMRTLASYRGFSGGLSLHAGAALICYVWNHSTADSPDEPLLVAQSEAYRQRCDAEGFYLVNGAAWYITYGDSTDWGYGRRGTLDYTLEVSVEKTPPVEELAGIVDDHMDAVLDFVGREPPLRGRVVDAVTGEPLEASLTPTDGWPSLSGPDGRFARWLPGPQVELEVEAWGYQPLTVAVDLGEGSPVELELALERDALLSLRPEPALLSWGDQERELLLAGVEDERVTLVRPGFPSVELQREGDGYPVVSSALEPGPWSIVTAGGTAPRALFVGERSDRVRLVSASLEGDLLRLEGHGFEVGTRAWALGGLARGLVPLELLEAGSESLLLDGGPLATLDDPIDLLVISSGAQLAALGLAAGGVVDTAAPGDSDWTPSDSLNDSEIPLAPGGGGCGCASRRGRSFAPRYFLVTLACVFPLWQRRRNPCRRCVSPGSESSTPTPSARCAVRPLRAGSLE